MEQYVPSPSQKKSQKRIKGDSHSESPLLLIRYRLKAGTNLMSSGIRGTFVIDWSQTEIDGMPDLEPQDLGQGARWLWRGEHVRLDGPSELLSLGHFLGEDDLRGRAEKSIQKILDEDAFDFSSRKSGDFDDMFGSSVRLTDGRNEYRMNIVSSALGPLCVFVDQLPDPEKELWVVERGLRTADHTSIGKGVICVSADCDVNVDGAYIKLDDIKAGAYVATLDKGAVPILWTGDLIATGARLHMTPQLKPVRIKAGALGHDLPTKDTLVSPRQRVLVRGRIAEDLFNCNEVLVMAKDLVNGRTIFLDNRVKHIHYKMLLFHTHQVFFANGIALESFHPAHADLEMLTDDVRASLEQLLPMLGGKAEEYGDDVRRGLSASEAAILKFAQTGS